MTTKPKEKEVQDYRKSGAEKSVSVWGTHFIEVLRALLETKPMPKSEKENKNYKPKGGQYV